jgi:Catalase
MSLTDNDLFVNEHFKFGDKASEIAEFRNHAERVLKAQGSLANAHSSGQPRRVFHAKSHGCLTGKLNLLSNRPENTRHGIFASGGKTSYNVLARFSNGVGFDEHDLIPDVRGVALKIFGVLERSTSTDTQPTRTVDFLMTNSTNAFGRDQEEFVQFMENSMNPASLGLFFLQHTEVAQLLLKATLRIVPSLVTEQYWSGHAYLLGPNQAMKFNVRPSSDTDIEVEDTDLREEMTKHELGFGSIGDEVQDNIQAWLQMLRKEISSKVNPNYLSIDLLKRARSGPIKFIFSVQLEKDTVSTPIENALIEWKESDSPSIPVAELVLDQREIFLDCNNLRFTPGHYIPDHRPLGNIGRGRIFTYEASQIGRRATSEEPAESTFFAE